MPNPELTHAELLILISEPEKAVENKDRTLDDVDSSDVREILKQESEAAIKILASTGIGVGAISSTTLLAGTAAGVIAGSTIAGSTAGVGIGAATGASSLVVGATAGSVVPIVGTIIGAAIGTGAGIIFGKRAAKKKAKKKMAELREALEKQNRHLRQLEAELEELKKKYKETCNENERFKYILSIIKSQYDLQSLLNVA